MLNFSRAKAWSIALAVLVALVYAVPSALPPSAQDWMRQYLGAKPITLGLDLQGGSNVVLEIDGPDLQKKLLDQATSDIRTTLREAKIGYKGVSRGPNSVTVTISNPAEVEQARTELQKLQSPIGGGVLGGGVAVNLYDLSGSANQYTLTLSESGYQAKVAQAISQSLKIVENRVNAMGTTEPVIQQQGTDRIGVQLPGVEDPEQLKNILGQTAKLTFQLLCADQPTGSSQQPPPECKSLPLKDDANTSIWVQTSSVATVDGADLTDSQPSIDQQNQPVVTFKFNQKGAFRFAKLTAENVGKPFAIILDDKVVSYPNINEPITGGSGQISGRFTQQETNDLALVLRSGALPAKLTIVEERTVGPSLGADSVRAGVLASIVGLIGVLAFMMLSYQLFGLFANIALVANLLMLLAIMSVFGFTLTLPGIAGIVLTMGMAVDSNVLVFERIREEWRAGRSAIASIETGFRQAFVTILDANLTTLIAAFVLFGVGSGPVRGFAVTLSVGILTTILTAFTLTRLIVAIWVRRWKPKHVPL
jgi:protein-export membrane protein SecD